MLGNTYDSQICSVARSLEVIGERWTVLIIRDAFLGVRRFDDFQRSLGIARNVLQGRLERLVDNGILERVRYQERPERFEYKLTGRLDLWPVVVFVPRGRPPLGPRGPAGADPALRGRVTTAQLRVLRPAARTDVVSLRPAFATSRPCAALRAVWGPTARSS